MTKIGIFFSLILASYFLLLRISLMEFLQSIFLGLLQGITEFLPVSSSGHLFLAEKFLGLVPDLHFEIALHVASLIAIFIVFWRKIWSILRGMGSMCRICAGKREEGVLGWKLFVASLATIPIALFVEERFEFFRTIQSVGGMLIITGALIFFSEKFRQNCLQSFTWSMAILLGIIQGMAVIPGISRAGLTISFLIFMGIERRKSAEISFLLAIPAILGALVFSLSEGLTISLSQFLGCVASLFSALFAIRWMLHLVRKNWVWFVPYCVVVGIAILVFV